MIANLLIFVSLLTSLFLIVLVLIQRGKGGGLAGALGGMGGQSAFGTKAGDLFTKITIGVAAFWIVLLIAMVKILGVSGSSSALSGLGEATDQSPAATAPASPGKAPAGQAEAPAPSSGEPEKGETK